MWSEENKNLILPEEVFAEGGPYWHLYTSGNISEIIFRNDAELNYGITNLAICINEFEEIRIITDILMSNHIHQVLEGERARCEEMFNLFKSRLKLCYSRRKQYINLSNFNCNLREIINVKSMCNTIAYVNRNGYVNSREYTPYSYPWGSGNLYFNKIIQDIKGIPFNNLKDIERRSICKSRSIKLPEKYCVNNDMILPISYSSYKKGESFFRDANHYFYAISKNVESYREISKELEDQIFLTDNELYAVVYNIALRQYKLSQPSLLPASAKIDIAKKMKFEYHASNGQIRRILKIEQHIVDGLFPPLTK